MSRVANNPIPVPQGVEVILDGSNVSVKGSKGELTLVLHEGVAVDRDGDTLRVSARDEEADSRAMAGTMRSLLNNMVIGVSEGYERRLTINGVGYRAQAQGKSLALTLGFSHPVQYPVPEGIDVETPSNTEILVKGVDKQLVGQVSAEIRAFRPPEPYKGKGVRYADERVRRKEAKKK
jgi:large subunit ribosomal protein L6